eukprot:m.251539 g.251539  ORF g.251539 m.251539 type:complete len:384 (-) comp17296_c0_seq1:168-1319(-)
MAGQMERVSVSAPGKVILHGEHAVVYGKLAIAASLNLRSFLHLAPASDGHVSMDLPDITLRVRWQLEALQGIPRCGTPNTPCAPTPEQLETLHAALKQASVSDNSSSQDMAMLSFLFLFINIAGPQSVSVVVNSQLPIGAGLGSSAAFCVCVAAGLLASAGVVDSRQPFTAATRDLINAWAFEAEKLIHGTPSGIDNCISAYGGARQFAAGKSEPLAEVPCIRILLVNTRVPRSTKALVARVRENHTLVPAVVNPILDSVENLSREASLCYADLFAIQRNASTKSAADVYAKLGYLIDVNQALLTALGVGHPALDAVGRMAAAHGLHAKLTGAGGGGCAWLLIPDGTDAAVVAAAMASIEGAGMAVWETTMGGPGVQMEDGQQ